MSFHADVAGYVHVEPAVAPVSQFNSGDTANQTNIAGIQVDTQGLTAKYHSAKLGVTVLYSLTSGRSIVMKADFQERSATSGAGSTWANFGTTGS